ncbi:hypothetical protein CH35J_012862 [Colletotrichum higginsianum]|uniref:Integrase catalytic domain-containing protein n=1 Tax=Colletotrichum higginsianum TaxID=80884 RepID=A0A4T0VCV6_9PEZI|nr:hypothetical protein CH35J_012862 [Colletotrichum higginsianum]
MDRLKIQFDNLDDVLRQGDVAVPIVRKWGHPWMLLSPPEKVIAAGNHMTEVELRRLPRRFGHPSVYRLHKLLREAGQEVHLDAIRRLTKYCHHYQLHSHSPHRFRFAIRDAQDYAFHHGIIVDVMYLDGNKPALHIVDPATAFNAAIFPKDTSAKSTWEALRPCWIDVYQGPPDWILADAGRNPTAAEFRQEAKAMSIDVKNSSPSRTITASESWRDTTLLCAGHTRSPEKNAQHCRETLPFKAPSSPSTTPPDLTASFPPSSSSALIPERSMAPHHVRKIHARRQVDDALATRNGPDTSSLKKPAIGSQADSSDNEGIQVTADDLRRIEESTVVVEIPQRRGDDEKTTTLVTEKEAADRALAEKV